MSTVAKDTLVTARSAAVQQPTDRVVVERSLHRALSMGDPRRS
ncbi:hypothetical protein [Streptomyces sp. NPDC050121]